MKTQSVSINWSNIDLGSAYERDQNILDPYDFDTLLLEIDCNQTELTDKTITEQFETSLKSKIDTARWVFSQNKNNILKKAIQERKSK